MMKPSPQSQRFIYENQTPSAISDQTQQPSGQGYQGRTGKAINCQSPHRSTSRSTTATPSLPPPTHPCPQTHMHGSSASTVQQTHVQTDARSFSFCALCARNIWSSLSLFYLNSLMSPGLSVQVARSTSCTA